jgi:signal transduction histidine kinase
MGCEGRAKIFMKNNCGHNAKMREPTAGAVASGNLPPSAPVPAPPCGRGCLTHVAHLWSQPLTALRGSLELALLTAQEPADLRRFVQEALEQAQEMVRLVALLRELAEAENGVAEAEPVWLSELVAEVWEDIRALAESKEICLRVPKGEDVQVWTPRARLRRAFLRILYRTIQRGPGGRTVQIEILQAGEHGCLEVRTYSATGALHAADSRVEFYPLILTFDALKESTGLEWLIAIQIIRNMGGTILSDGPPAAAQHFRIYLPLDNRGNSQITSLQALTPMGLLRRER